MYVFGFLVIVILISIYELRKLLINNVEIKSFIVSMSIAVLFGVIVIVGKDIFNPIQYINKLFKPFLDIFNRMFL